MAIKGQAIIEILLAVSILTIALTATILVVFGNQFLLMDRQFASRAEEFATEGIEAVKSIVDSDWSNLANGQHGLIFTNNEWRFSGTQDAKDIFTRKIIVSTTTDSNIKEVKSVVSWQAEPTRTLKVEILYLATNWKISVALGGDTGGGPPFGDWQNPRTLGSIDLGPGNQGTDLDAVNKIVYMTAEASAASKPDFFIIDATNGQNPFIVSSINTGTGLLGVDTAGNYAYVVGKDDGKEFQVIDISNRSAPTVVATLNLPGGADGFTVFYYGGYAYVGRADGAPQEFVIINVSNPLSPSVVSGLSGVGDEINDIYVFNGRAYLGTEDNSRSMIVIDVSSSTAPVELGSLNIGMHVYGIYVQSEPRIYVGGKTKFYVSDASNPSNIITMGSSTIGNKTRDVAFASPYAFLGTEDSNKEFQVWNVSNPNSIAFWSSFNFPQVATGVDYEDNLVYVSVRSNDALRIITSQ